MPFKINHAVVPKEKKVKEVVLPIFERSKKQAVWKMSHDRNLDEDVKTAGSLEQARGRYVDGPAYDPATTSYNWKVKSGVKSKYQNNKAGVKVAKNETVEVCFKAGGRKVSILDDIVNNRSNVATVEVASDTLVGYMEKMLAHLKSMKIDSEDGEKFHKLQIIAAKPKKTKTNPNICAYDSTRDDWKVFGKTGDSITERKEQRDRFLAKPLNRDNWHNHPDRIDGKKK